MTPLIKNHFTKADVLKEIKGILFMILGCIAYGAATGLFTDPNNIVAGGITGLAIIFKHIGVPLEIGTMIIIMNVPIAICAIKSQGIKFVLRCILTTTVLGIVTNIFAGINKNNPIFFENLAPNIITENSDGVLASLYAGVFQGVGIGLFVRYQFSSGGTELLARLFARIFKGISIPLMLGLLDGIVVVSGAIVTKNPSNLLFALIIVFVSTKVSEIVLVGLDKSKLCIIISDKSEEIAKTLIEKSPRGVTYVKGYGMYTQRERGVLITCVKNQQLTQLKNIVKEIDDKSFIIINDSVEVRGQGFQSLNENEKK